MDFMKVFDQTVREIKREVNLKVLKVPEIEQKVLDATDNEPWGPHGSALAEIAQATKKFSECQMVMNVLWTRLIETGKDWRYVYKSLAVIEYLVANGSERAVDDIVEHTFQISALTSFEYVEPNGKDMGINVRKKAENIISLLNNKDKIQDVRNKAASNRDKYFGLSSTGISYKSSSSAFGSGASLSSDRYGGALDSDSFRGGFRERDTYRDSKTDQDDSAKNQDNTLKSKSGYRSREPHSTTSSASKSSTRSKDSSDYRSVPPQSSSINPNNYEDDFDDFDPRGTASSKVKLGGAPQVDLVGPNLIDDIMDAPASAPTEKPPMASSSSEVDLFADATFVSAPSHAQNGSSSESQNNVDLFATQTTIPPVSSPVDLFAAPTPVTQSEAKPPPSSALNIIDPFAAVPLNTFNSSDLFGAFTSQSNLVSSEASQHPPINGSDHSNRGGQPFTESKTPPKKDGFQVKSGIWADSLTRGLIDLNISAPKKVSLVDVGVVGGLSDMSDVREKGPPTYNMGRAMGAGSGLGRSGPLGSATSSPSVGGDDFFSQLSGQQYQFGGLQK